MFDQVRLKATIKQALEEVLSKEKHLSPLSLERTAMLTVFGFKQGQIFDPSKGYHIQLSHS
jgi:hypothetical protein